MTRSLFPRLGAPLAGLLLVALCGAGCAANRPPAAGPATARGERTAVLLHINDVYRIEGVEGGTVGDLARLRTLREELEREAPDLLVSHGGDILFPSFLSRTYNGEQMIDVLNNLDGDPAAFDNRMFAVFGNHEFDKDKAKDAPLLDQRVEQSQFRWLNGTVVFANGADGKPVVAADNLAPTWIVESGGIRIGIFGLTVGVKQPEYATEILGPIETARKLAADLRARGAEVVIGLTHLNVAEDKDLLESLGADGPDLILGGHDHEAMAIEAGGRWLFKADADARTAVVVHLTLPADGRLAVRHELRPLTDAAGLTPDPAVQARVDGWLEKHEKMFCGKQGEPMGCLEKVVGHSRVQLDAEENKIRGSETNLGDWIADRMTAAFAACGAQGAFINSGSLRLNQDLAPGAITQQSIEELFAYPTPIHLVRIDGSILEKVADQAVRGWPGSGSWLQISGFAYTHDQESRDARDLTLLARGGARPVDPAEPLLLVVGDYLVNPQAGDQDGYTMLKPDQVVKDCAADGKDLKELVVEGLAAAEPGGIAPEADGRICQGTPAAPCRAVER